MKSPGPKEGREQALSLFPELGEDRVGLVLDAIAKGINVVPSSSCGRLFDAVSAMTGACRRASFGESTVEVRVSVAPPGQSVFGEDGAAGGLADALPGGSVD